MSLILVSVFVVIIYLLWEKYLGNKMLPDKDFLSETNFFKNSVSAKFLKHDILFREKDKADKAFYICKGIITIVKRNGMGEAFQIYRVNAGALIGIQDVYGSGIYNTTAIAIEPVIAHEISKKEIENKLKRVSSSKAIFARWLSGHLLSLENTLLKE